MPSGAHHRWSISAYRLENLVREGGFALVTGPPGTGKSVALRQTWLTHVEATRSRAVLRIDEAQELAPTVLAELRILASTDFDSRSLLTVVLSGDERLTQQFRRDELLPIASRLRVRLVLGSLDPPELMDWLRHVLEQAGNPHLMTEEVMTTLTEHAAGNLRVLATMGQELLALAAREDKPQIDQQLYLQAFTPPTRPPRRPRPTPALASP